MKKFLLIFSLFAVAINIQAQDKEDDGGKPSGQPRFFTGGGLNIGFSSYSTNLGISPVFGYSLTNFMDMGVSLDLNYVSQRNYDNTGDKMRQTIIGPGAFMRIFPVNFLFGSAEYQYNFMRYKAIPSPGNPNATSYKMNVRAPSLLLGLGYAAGRFPGSNSYYYFSVSWDVMRDPNSPYVDSHGQEFPFFRAGYIVSLGK